MKYDFHDLDQTEVILLFKKPIESVDYATIGSFELKTPNNKGYITFDWEDLEIHYLFDEETKELVGLEFDLFNFDKDYFIESLSEEGKNALASVNNDVLKAIREFELNEVYYECMTYNLDNYSEEHIDMDLVSFKIMDYTMPTEKINRYNKLLTKSILSR